MDIRQLSLEQLRTNISSVTQDVFLFSDTINENIKLGVHIRFVERNPVKAHFSMNPIQYDRLFGFPDAGFCGIFQQYRMADGDAWMADQQFLFGGGFQ
mgnify:CR=1 FL=1